MPDFDEMTHVELARHADALRERMRNATIDIRTELEHEMEQLDAAARRRPQQITGTMGAPG